MKANQQSLHDESWPSRAGKEGDAQKLDDVLVAEGAHQLTFFYKPFFCLGWFLLVAILQHGVDSFRSGPHYHFLYFSVGSATYDSSSRISI